MKSLKIIQSGLLGLFGAVSIFMTTSIIFNLFGIREKEGNYVLFIVYANLVCGLIYLYSAYLIWKNNRILFYSLLIALLVLIVAFVSLFVHINNGGIYEEKTIKAMLFRISFTAVFTVISYLSLKKNN